MRVCVTGVGAVTAAGQGAPSLAAALAEGRSCLRPSEELDGRLVGRIPAAVLAGPRGHLDTVGHVFVQTAREAWHQAGLDVCPPRTPERVALLEGTSLGPMGDLIDAVREPGRRQWKRPSSLIRFMPGSGGSAFAVEKDIQGLVQMIAAGSASSAFALGQACLLIQTGQADVVVAGGAELPLHGHIAAPFVSARILAPPGEPCRPLDEGRQGPSLGQGSGVLILESEAHARARRADILARIEGFGYATEARSLTAPDPTGRGVARAAESALAAAGGEGTRAVADGVQWVALHGTGTPVNDRAECESLGSLFGSYFPGLPLTALKSTVGHCLGASAALEAVGAILAMRGSFIPAIPTLRRVDPQLPRCDAVTEVRSGRTECVLLLAESFGGRCAALVVSGARCGPRRIRRQASPLARVERMSQPAGAGALQSSLNPSG